ncbi:uncharacterized protein LOC106476002 [Limulus polyphemus]|uniref:Uncharacterized protein LOC106476002 n=1 Tax=Limulus polyphemus TaxID=6850 RepID=A0ABM1RWE5_LIMPO|nr:uncharacterized protein LOC106476002 [Limulus polyphemus]
MKLMKWVGGHFGRSRRKGKRDGEKEQPRENLERLEPLSHANCYPQQVVTQLPRGCYTPQLFPRHERKVPNIRTSFLDLAAAHDVNSPRQRSRIRTNPWLSCTRSSICGSVDSGWSGSSFSSSSEASDVKETRNRTPSVPWISSSSTRSGRDVNSLTTLQTSCQTGWDAKEPYRLYSNPNTIKSNFKSQPSLERVNYWLAPPGLTPCYKSEANVCTFEVENPFSENCHSSEDICKNSITEESFSSDVDSACGTSISITPLSETVANDVSDLAESLDDKVKRLIVERHFVEEKITRIREEEQLDNEQKLRLHQELLEYRRDLVMRTLKGLRLRVEQQNEQLRRSFSKNQELRTNEAKI